MYWFHSSQDTSPDAPILPLALEALIGTKHIFEIKSHTYYHCGEYGSFNAVKVFAPAIDGDALQVVNPLENVATSNASSWSLLKQVSPLDTPTKDSSPKLHVSCMCWFVCVYIYIIYIMSCVFK